MTLPTVFFKIETQDNNNKGNNNNKLFVFIIIVGFSVQIIQFLFLPNVIVG
jgi:hypothetical protein